MDESIINFRQQSTWRLFGLGVITYGVYLAHYIKEQTGQFNKQMPPESVIPEGFANFILTVSYLSLALFFVYMTVDEQHPLAQLSNLVDLLSSISMIVWGFMASRRMNTRYGFERDSKHYFHWLWTFLFTPLYFNYKINCLCENLDDVSLEG